MAGYIGNKAVGLNVTTGDILGDVGVGGDYFSKSLGTSNLRLGVNAGDSIASGGNFNVVVGDEAGTAITTADSNTAVGFEALKTNTTAGQLTAVGAGAGKTASSGGGTSTYIGYNAGTIATGASNTMVGGGAGVLNVAGSSNTFLGTGAGGNVTSGDSNIMIGKDIDAATATADNQLNIGGWITGQAGSIVIGAGIATARAKLEVMNADVEAAFDANNLVTWRVMQVRNDIEQATGTAAGIAFGGDGGGDTKTAGIVGISDNSTGGVCQLAFITATGNSSVERMRINSGGNVLTGCTAVPSASEPSMYKSASSVSTLTPKV